MLGTLLLRFILFIHASKRYTLSKKFIRDILTNSNNPYKKYLDIMIIFLIITSVIILIYEVKNPIPYWLEFYDIYVVSLIFFIEYLLRLWVYNDISSFFLREYKKAEFLQKEFYPFSVLKKGLFKKLHYMVTPTAIIDLLAIFPSYRPLRVLRIFVLFRVLKLLKYTKSINQFIDVLSSKKFELLTLLFLLFFVVMTAGIAIYVLEEKQNSSINSLFDAVYWALVTISSVGYGDISPITTEGRTLSILVIVSGIAMISFGTSVIVTAFSEKLTQLKENRLIEQINKRETFLIICGYGQMTKMFLRQATSELNNYIILDKDKNKIEEALKEGYSAINEDASRYEVLKKFNVQNAKISILCLMDSDIENVYISLNAKSISLTMNVIARASNSSMVNKFKQAGVNHIILPNQVANVMIHTAITQPTMYKALHSILTGKNIAKIDEINVCKSIVGVTLEVLDFKSEKLLFIGIHREGKFMFNPSLENRIEKNDVLLVMGRHISLENFKEKHNKEIL